MPHETIIVQKTEHVQKITLNRPESLNALNEKMGEELNAALKEADKDEKTRCLVITGAGRAFCAGEDVAGLKERYSGGSQPSLRAHLQEKNHPLIMRMPTMEKPRSARSEASP